MFCLVVLAVHERKDRAAAYLAAAAGELRDILPGVVKPGIAYLVGMPAEVEIHPGIVKQPCQFTLLAILKELFAMMADDD